MAGWGPRRRQKFRYISRRIAWSCNSWHREGGQQQHARASRSSACHCLAQQRCWPCVGRRAVRAACQRSWNPLASSGGCPSRSKPRARRVVPSTYTNKEALAPVLLLVVSFGRSAGVPWPIDVAKTCGEHTEPSSAEWGVLLREIPARAPHARASIHTDVHTLPATAQATASYSLRSPLFSPPRPAASCLAALDAPACPLQLCCPRAARAPSALLPRLPDLQSTT